ncbi:hypothetical protein ANN_23577 [Periplaneta americana]|uniref:Uncharacterized protein n=1 Tax=Periplaneta americana TaxID=6978 RepID=A0ABQ8SME2_PERAM|nr:hypothetical protein ANN_23577 [Periplaneta americana]
MILNGPTSRNREGSDQHLQCKICKTNSFYTFHFATADDASQNTVLVRCGIQHDSTRRADIVVIDRKKNTGTILDLTIRFEKDAQRPKLTDAEQRIIYEPSIPYFSKQYDIMANRCNRWRSVRSVCYHNLFRTVFCAGKSYAGYLLSSVAYVGSDIQYCRIEDLANGAQGKG